MKNFPVWSPVTCDNFSAQTTPGKLLDVVAVLADKPEPRFAVGQVGTIVEVLAPDIFEVEFCDPSGITLQTS